MSSDCDTAGIPGSGIERPLRRAWRKGRLRDHARGAAVLVVAAAALAAADFALDWLVRLPPWPRLGLLALNAGILSWLLRRHWWQRLARYEPASLALQAERCFGNLQSLLVSAVQLAGTALPAGTSRDLVREVQRRARAAAASLDFGRLVGFAEVKRLSGLAAGALALAAAVALAFPAHSLAFWQRMAHPFSGANYPSRTRIEMITGHVTIPEGEAVAIRLEAAGRVPPRAALRVRAAGSAAWDRVPLEPGPGNTFSRRFEGVFRSFDYHARVGDMVSPTYRVEVVPPPRVVSAAIGLTYPAYLERPPRTNDSLNADVVEGTRLAWRVTVDRPLATASLLAGGTALPMTVLEDGRTVTAETSAEASFSYQFHWKLRSHGYEYRDDVNYFVQVTPDEPPRVELLEPQAQTIKATRRKVLRLRFRAQDDFRVAQAAIVYRVNEGPEARTPIGAFADRSVTADTDWRPADAVADLKEGDAIVFQIEAADNRGGPKGPNVARSPARVLQVVSEENYLQGLAGEKSRLRDELGRLYKEEQEGWTNLKAIQAGESNP